MGPLHIHWSGVHAAVLYTARFFLLLLAGSLLTLTTTPVALTDAAEYLLAPLERVGVPVRQGTLVLSIALRFVPTLSQEAEHIVAAQTARGADLENKGALAYARACVPLIVPLFASALRHAENLGRAMDARCYTGGERTHYHVMRLVARRDAPAIAALALYLAASSRSACGNRPSPHHDHVHWPTRFREIYTVPIILRYPLSLICGVHHSQNQTEHPCRTFPTRPPRKPRSRSAFRTHFQHGL